MKRDRAADCDPFSLEDFEGMDTKLIITVGEDRFHLPSLYAWVVDRKQNRNPLTNLPFDEHQLELIRSEACARFPLTLSLCSLTGKARNIETTSLASPLGVIPLVMPGTETLFEFMATLSERGEFFTLKAPQLTTERALPLVSLMDKHDSFKDLGFDVNKIVVFHHQMPVPSQSLMRNTLFCSIAKRNGWPFDEFESRARIAQCYVDNP